MEDVKRHNILVVDDEKNILSSLRRLLRNENYNMLFAGSAAEGLEILNTNAVHLVLSDQRMPGMNGTEFLAMVKEKYPDIIRIILSGYTDIDSMAEAINKGHIYKFLLKPWNDQNLILEIRQALDQCDLMEANRALQQKVLAQNKGLKAINESLEKIVRERTRELEIKNHALELSQAVLDDLPVPVLGITPDGMIALINKAAIELDVKNGPFAVGNSIGMYFDDMKHECIFKALDDPGETIIKCPETDKLGGIIITPLTGRFSGRGKIMTFHGQ